MKVTPSRAPKPTSKNSSTAYPAWPESHLKKTSSLRPLPSICSVGIGSASFAFIPRAPRWQKPAFASHRLCRRFFDASEEAATQLHRQAYPAILVARSSRPRNSIRVPRRRRRTSRNYATCSAIPPTTNSVLSPPASSATFRKRTKSPPTSNSPSATPTPESAATLPAIAFPTRLPSRLAKNSGIKLEPTWFIEMLNSLSWSDRARALTAWKSASTPTRC